MLLIRTDGFVTWADVFGWSFDDNGLLLWSTLLQFAMQTPSSPLSRLPICTMHMTHRHAMNRKRVQLTTSTSTAN